MAKTSKPVRTQKVSAGSKAAAAIRATANKLTDEERHESMSFAMRVIYGKGKKAAHAVRH
jgi:hypothetical protein